MTMEWGFLYDQGFLPTEIRSDVYANRIVRIGVDFNEIGSIREFLHAHADEISQLVASKSMPLNLAPNPRRARYRRKQRLFVLILLSPLLITALIALIGSAL